jgi:hypothetical protein
MRFPPGGRELSQHALERGGHGNREDRPDHAQQRAAGHHDRDGREARQLDRPAVDERLDQVVLDLLVDQDYEENDHGRSDAGARVRDQGDDDRRDQGADLGDQVEQPDDQGEHDRERSADDHGSDSDQPRRRSPRWRRCRAVSSRSSP